MMRFGLENNKSRIVACRVGSKETEKDTSM